MSKISKKNKIKKSMIFAVVCAMCLSAVFMFAGCSGDAKKDESAENTTTAPAVTTPAATEPATSAATESATSSTPSAIDETNTPAAAAAAATPNDAANTEILIGEWKIVGGEFGGVPMDEDQLQTYGTMNFTFKDDGTANFTVIGKSYENMKYELKGDGVVFSDPSVASIKLRLVTTRVEKNRLEYEPEDQPDSTLALAGTKLIFEKQ